MGTWGPGPFDGDAAAEFLEELRASPWRAVSRALHTVTKAADGDYLDVDVGGAAWAACEVVALSFGYGESAVTDGALEGVGKRGRRRSCFAPRWACRTPLSHGSRAPSFALRT
jgi:hypothetical protein